jgi:hypothetical protein
MALNKKRIARSQQSTKGGSGDFLKLRDGKNTWRILTFPHVVSKADFTRGIYKVKDDVNVGDEFDEIEREVPRHFTEEGVVNCIGANCPWCAEAAELLASSKESDKKAGKQLNASHAFYMNVVDMEDIEKGVQIGQMPPSVFNAILNYVSDPEYGDSVLGCKGRDFIIERDSNESPAKMYKVRIRDKDRCEDIDETLQDQVRDMFKMNALEPGWSSVESLNKAEKVDGGETSKEKVNRRREEAPADDEKDLKDRKPAAGKAPADDDGAPPWEKGKKGAEEAPRSSKRRAAPEEDEKPKINVEDIVVFTDAGQKLHGEVKEINDGIAVIKAGKFLYDIPLTECKLDK